MTYNEGKEKARELAHEFETYRDENLMSWRDCADWWDKLESLAKRYGLVREFKENGII